jgi:hypothetical protein
MTDDMKETLGRLDERTERIMRLLEGNGTPGLVQRVDELESLADKAKGLLWFSGAGGVGGALSAVYHWITRH